MEILHHHRDLGEVFPGQSVLVLHVPDKHSAICLQRSVEITMRVCLHNMKLDGV